MGGLLTVVGSPLLEKFVHGLDVLAVELPDAIGESNSGENEREYRENTQSAVEIPSHKPEDQRRGDQLERCRKRIACSTAYLSSITVGHCLEIFLGL